jgi:uncharacterized protein
MALNAAEARVLGALMEKEMTTPEYYPLSLNALVNACNQKNNRDPAMQLDEDEVRMALHRLEDQGLAGAARGMESRVTKYEHRTQEAFNFTRGEAALLCVLLLRGAQTPGELRGRTERMHGFAELEEVHAALRKLMERDPALAAALPRQPGTKEIRYAQLLSGETGAVSSEGSAATHASETHADTGHSGRSVTEERLSRLETEVTALREELAELRAALAGKEETR